MRDDLEIGAPRLLLVGCGNGALSQNGSSPRLFTFGAMRFRITRTRPALGVRNVRTLPFLCSIHAAIRSQSPKLKLTRLGTPSAGAKLGGEFGRPSGTAPQGEPGARPFYPVSAPGHLPPSDVCTRPPYPGRKRPDAGRTAKGQLYRERMRCYVESGGPENCKRAPVAHRRYVTFSSRTCGPPGRMVRSVSVTPSRGFSRYRTPGAPIAQ